MVIRVAARRNDERSHRMSAPDFALTLERRAGGTTVLALAGELDLHRAPEIERALAEAIEPEAAQEGQGNRVLLPAFRGYISHPRVVASSLICAQ